MIDFLHGTFHWDHSERIDVSRLLYKSLADVLGRNEAVVRATCQYVMQDVAYYSPSSRCAYFFQQFLIREFTIIDFEFFNLLFNPFYSLVYPPIDKTRNDPDIEPETALFLIHTDLIQAIIRELFMGNEKLFDLGELRKETRNSPHPDLVDFFAFATQMIIAFRSTHRRFHAQVHNLLSLIRWDPYVEMTEGLFKQFFILVDPIHYAEWYGKIWDRFRTETNLLNPDQHLTAQTFIRFCSDFPVIADTIMGLPHLENFQMCYDQLAMSMFELIGFLVKRFTGVVLPIYEEVQGPMKDQLEHPIIIIRNSLMRVDMSTALHGYRKFLQFVDIRFTDERPFYEFPVNLSMEDVKNITNRFSARESLALSWFPSDGEILKQIRARQI
jgi:hypothetical protein